MTALRTLPGLDARQTATLIRALSDRDGGTDAQAFVRLSEWSTAENDYGERLFSLARSLGQPETHDTGSRLSAFDAGDVAGVLLSYRFERVVVALAWHANMRAEIAKVP